MLKKLSMFALISGSIILLAGLLGGFKLLCSSEPSPPRPPKPILVEVPPCIRLEMECLSVMNGFMDPDFQWTNARIACAGMMLYRVEYNYTSNNECINFLSYMTLVGNDLYQFPTQKENSQ